MTEPNLNVYHDDGYRITLYKPGYDLRRCERQRGFPESNITARVACGIAFILLWIVAVVIWLPMLLAGLVVVPLVVFFFRSAHDIALDMKKQLLCKLSYGGGFGNNHTEAKSLKNSLEGYINALKALDGAPRDYLIRDFVLFYTEVWEAACTVEALLEAEPFAKAPTARKEYEKALKSVRTRVNAIEEIASGANTIAFKFKMAEAQRGDIPSGMLEHLTIQTLSLQESIMALEGL